jgi:hypothetical protein
MSSRLQLTAVVVLALMIGLLQPARGHEGPGLHGKPAVDMASTAQAFWKSLTPEQQAKAGFEWKSEERLNWHFIPRPRKGLPLKEMNAEQRQAALAVLKSGVSQQGFKRIETIMSLEEVLQKIEQGRGPARDSEMYFVSVFGKPGDATWGWRFEGHHLSMNFTVVNQQAVGHPAFMGTNPGEVKDGPKKGTRGLGEEEDLGRALVIALSADQKKAAIVAEEAPKDIITGNARQAKLLMPQGIAYSALETAQKQQLMNLVKVYANWLRPELAEQDIK